VRQAVVCEVICQFPFGNVYPLDYDVFVYVYFICRN